jgi:hypothetical protein
MPALVSALLSPSATNGERGGSSLDGNQTTAISVGQRRWDSNSSSGHSSYQDYQERTSNYTATTGESSKDGGKAAAETDPPIPFFVESTSYQPLAAALSTLVTSQAKSTRPTIHHEASTRQPPSSSPYSTFQVNSHLSSQTSIQTHHTLNSTLANAILHPPRTQNLRKNTLNPQNTGLPMTNLNSGTRSNSVRRKTNNNHGNRDNTLPPAPTSSTPAAYSINLTPRPSPLRPHCLGRERLRLWKPTQARSTQDEEGQLVNVTDSDLERILDVMSQAWEEGTRETYGSGLLMFHVYCDNKDIPELQRAPVSKILLSSFISELAGAYSGKTIANYVYGIRAWHVLHGMTWQLNEPETMALLTAASKLTPPSSKRKKRCPYTLDYMIKLKGQLDLQNPLDAATFACLTTCFYAVGRVGEFTVTRLTGFDPTKHVTPANLRQEKDRNGLQVTVLHLPSTKTSSEGEDVSWARQNGPTDPYEGLENHMQVNQPPADGHLFAYKWKSGHRPLTKKTFINRLAQAARKAGEDPLQGHGIRIGSTLEYLLRGISMETMKIIGRWASDAFTLYLRKHAQILAPYLQALPELHHAVISNTMRIR